MGIFDRLKGNSAPQVQAAEGFTVIDVETTGLSPRSDRIVEVAFVRTDPLGNVVGEWSSRINPEGPVGATHIHGIKQSDVDTAPLFRELVPHLNGMLAGTAIVGHNVTFDLGFVQNEYARAGWLFPQVPSICTLAASDYYLPHLDRRRLHDCCEAAGVAHGGAHSALGDARATALLLARYLHPRLPPGARGEEARQLLSARSVVWPSGPGGVAWTEPPPRSTANFQRAAPKPPSVALVTLVKNFSLIDALDEGAPDGTAAYLEKVAEVLEDGELTIDEAASLDDLAEVHGLSDNDRVATHRAFVLALAHLALDDGKISAVERAELKTMLRLLSLPESTLKGLLDKAEVARLARHSAGLGPLPADWAHGEPLRVGDKVVFTGCDPDLRANLETRAETLGVRIMSGVNKRTAMLVTDGTFEGGKAADAADLGVRLVDPGLFATLLDNLQPAQ